MNFPPPLSLSLLGVSDAGVPNLERIVLRPTDTINTGAYGMLLGVRQATGAVFPLRDSFFWFGEVVVAPPCWILLYTRPGQYAVTRHTDGNAVHNFFWHRRQTVFTHEDIVPVLFEIGTLAVGGHISPLHKRLETNRRDGSDPQTAPRTT